MHHHPLAIGPLRLDSNLLFAPLSGISTIPVRLIAREYGAGLVFSEMIKAQGIVRGHAGVRHTLDMHPMEHPIGVQLADADPGALADAAGLAVERGADLIDLNCGCPVKKVVKTECGAALLRDPALIGRILTALRDAVPARVPVTLKMRVGWSDEALNGSEVARIAEASGAQAITVHGRTREQLYTGTVRLGAIRAVKEAVSIPVIGNGDILEPEDARAMFEATGCDGVMIGRGAVGNPWIFRRTAALLNGEPAPPVPALAEIRALLLRVVDLVVMVHGPGHGVLMMRKLIGYWSKGFPGVRAFRAGVMTISDPDVLRAFIEARFGTLAADADAGREPVPEPAEAGGPDGG
jgi:tRNA-dihydrouridine synthase B